MMKNKAFSDLKLEIQIQAKNGIDFMFAASIVWLAIMFIWTLEYSSYDKSIMTFIVGAIMLPLAFGISKIAKTNWKVKDNPLDPLGLWLNFAQLIYFPFLFFVLSKHPDYFIMTYAIVTGAHLFPYAWLYDEIGYAIWAVLISVGSFILAMNISIDLMWIVPLYTSILFLLLAIWVLVRINKKIRLTD